MSTPQLPRLVAVLVDAAELFDLLRLVDRLRADCPTAEVVAASAREVSDLVSRDVRLLCAADTQHLDGLIGHEMRGDRNVLVLPSTTVLDEGWVEAVAAQIAVSPWLSGELRGEADGVLVSPGASSAAHTGTALWRQGPCLWVGSAAASANRVTVSGIIVADGVAGLSETLTSIAGLVDEVVVVPTGDVEDVASVARRHSARLLASAWHDSFGDARNAAIDAASGDWIFAVEPGETVHGSPEELRAELDSCGSDTASVRFLLPGRRWDLDAASPVEERVFRRGARRWHGAYKEELRPCSPAAAPPQPARPTHMTITRHTVPGGAPDVARRLRNVRIADRELRDRLSDDPHRPVLVAHLGEALWHAGKPRQALRLLDEIKSESAGGAALVSAGRVAVKILEAQHRHDEAAEWLASMASWGESAGNIALTRARHLLSVPRARDAWAVIEPHLSGGSLGIDPWGEPCRLAEVESVGAQVLIHQRKGDAAIALLRKTMAHDPRGVLPWLVVEAHEVAGHPAATFLADAPEELLAHSLEILHHMYWRQALHWCDAFAAAHPDDVRPIAAGSGIAARAGWKLATAWAERARTAGWSHLNALQEMAHLPETAPLDRLVAATLLQAAFGQTIPEHLLQRAAVDLTEVERRELDRIRRSMAVAEPSYT